MSRNLVKACCITAILTTLFGCASKRAPTIQLTESYEANLNLMSKNMEQFYQSGLNKSIQPYMQLIGKVAPLEDEQQLCAKESIQNMEAARDINPSSLVANVLLAGCVANQGLDNSIYLYHIELISELLLSSGNGETIETAITIRENAEADLLFEISDYTVLETELVLDNNTILFRYHLLDNESGEYQHRYINNFRLLKSIVNTPQQSPQESILAEILYGPVITRTYIREFAARKVPSTIVFLTSKHIELGEYEKAIEILLSMEKRSPQMAVNLARAFLLNDQPEKIESVIDEVVTVSELGYIPATLFISQMMLTIDDTEETKQEVIDMLFAEERRQPIAESVLALADLLWKQEQYELAEYWYEHPAIEGYESERTSLFRTIDLKD